MTAQIIVSDIIKDLQDRSGLGDAWSEIDDNIKDEIVKAWEDIVVERVKLLK